MWPDVEASTLISATDTADAPTCISRSSAFIHLGLLSRNNTPNCSQILLEVHKLSNLAEHTLARYFKTCYRDIT
jgi:hypothetical protein